MARNRTIQGQFAAGNNEELSFQINGETPVYGIKFVSESLQDESVTIASASLEANKKYKSDTIAVESGQSGSLEIELFNSQSAQKLIHAANGDSIIGKPIKGSLMIAYRGVDNTVTIRMEGTEITISKDSVDTAFDTLGKSYAEIVSGLEAIEGMTAYFIDTIKEGTDSIPAKLDFMSASMVLLDGLNTEVILKNTFGFKGALLVESVIGELSLSYPTEPLPMTIQKGFTPLTDKKSWADCKVGSINLTVDTNAAIKASLTFLGGSGERVTSLLPITVPSGGTLQISTKQSLQFFGGIPYLAKQATIGINSNIEKLDSFQGITQGAQSTGLIDVTIGTTLRLDDTVDTDLLKVIESGIAFDYFFIAWVVNKSESDLKGYAGAYMFYAQRIKSEVNPPANGSSAGIVEVQPSLAVNNPESGEGVSVLTQ